MSFKHTAFALDHGPVNSLEKLVLLALCDRADENGVCFPSRADLMARTNVSASSLSRKLRMLEVQGWIQRKQRFNSSTVFRINLQRLERREAEAIAAKVARVPDGFEPFEDEVALLQPIENKGDAHSEHTDAHSEHTDAHSEHTDAHRASTNLSINQSSNLRRRKASAPNGAKPYAAKKSAPASSVAPVAIAPAMDEKTFALYRQLAKPQETRAAFVARLCSGLENKGAL